MLFGNLAIVTERPEKVELGVLSVEGFKRVKGLGFRSWVGNLNNRLPYRKGSSVSADPLRLYGGLDSVPVLPSCSSFLQGLLTSFP